MYEGGGCNFWNTLRMWFIIQNNINSFNSALFELRANLKMNGSLQQNKRCSHVQQNVYTPHYPEDMLPVPPTIEQKSRPFFCLNHLHTHDLTSVARQLELHQSVKGQPWSAPPQAHSICWKEKVRVDAQCQLMPLFQPVFSAGSCQYYSLIETDTAELWGTGKFRYFTSNLCLYVLMQAHVFLLLQAEEPKSYASHLFEWAWVY